jgi:hypothetical protein
VAELLPVSKNRVSLKLQHAGIKSLTQRLEIVSYVDVIGETPGSMPELE